ncbi:nitrate/sulfonate/bicarbonate ABC transporter ATP-binding protein [Methyloceanibacter superfactus]|uniref:Nitrate/sulfonate/bicarbonate ABC transporter ATP-binding protein n=1 Tax=Methyloceanibacter superfactus TaxID=1774969 RepID=A0A1E3W181_9HYPH|nr:nitrate ABC transporter ATP-binding protein [Methyloceanibacter superfactus]ODR99540.1 nitrate/sulfonate/bicarbonate ABC transporter ATP-binding protein [Methyloceanibacter superfactus]
MSILELKGVCAGFGPAQARTEVLKSIDLSVEDGELLAVLGFSGTGKTTLISLLAGLKMPDKGDVLFKGETVTGPGPERGVVFQSYALMPWLTVEENIALAVNAVHAKAPRAERKQLTEKYLTMVGLGHARERRPAELSGGMRQRVSVARALAMQPEVLLLDEPLSALDALTRAKLQDEFAEIRAETNATMVLITNDVDEAIFLADRIVPLNPDGSLGPIYQVDLPQPRNRVALNHDETYHRLRGDITKYLMDAGEMRKDAGEGGVALPNVVPFFAKDNVSNDALPAAYVKAATEARRADRYLDFSQISKTYPTPTGPLTVVDGFDLKMKKGEFVSLIGHSGCGKSTVLSMAAGLQNVSLGAVILDNRQVHEAGPDRAVVFQAPSLVPWLTAEQNVALGVDRVYPDASRAERQDVVSYYLNRVGLGGAMTKYAAELSNGMKQRVGLARAFALSPKLLLLDEPFGMLDSLTRWALQEVLMEVWTRTEVTAVCVTHDVDEAILLADRVVMMTNGPNARVGRIVEIDIPRPRTRQALLAHPRYYEYREAILGFLDEFEHGAISKADSGKPEGEKSLEAAA